MQFQDFNLNPLTQRAIKALGYTTPSPIQVQAIGPLLEGHDVMGLAATGTGKTAAFGIPLLEKIATRLAGNQQRGVQAIILCPTRELALQVTASLQALAQFHTGIHMMTIYGGQPIERQFKLLARGPHIVVGTPGRVLDHLRRGSLQLNRVQTVVLDEADEMLDMGFRDSIEQILKQTHADKRQTVLFSATMAPAIRELAQRYQQPDAQLIKIESHQAPITQRYLEIEPAKKLATLAELLTSQPYTQALVFCNTKRGVDRLAQRLKRDHGFTSEGLHGDMSQSKRDGVMRRFRAGQVNLLVATDVAARGLDISNVDAVYNYDMPKTDAFYVHRIGRTGRAGQEGQAISFVERSQFPMLKRLRKTMVIGRYKPAPPDTAIQTA